MSAKYFEYYTTILSRAVFSWTQCSSLSAVFRPCTTEMRPLVAVSGVDYTRHCWRVEWLISVCSHSFILSRALRRSLLTKIYRRIRKPSLEVAPTTSATFSVGRKFPRPAVIYLQFPIQVCFSTYMLCCDRFYQLQFHFSVNRPHAYRNLWSCDLDLWPMTWSLKMTWIWPREPAYQTSRSTAISFVSYCPDTQTHRHTHSEPTALCGPLKRPVITPAHRDCLLKPWLHVQFVACNYFRIWAGLSLSISVWLVTSYPKCRLTKSYYYYHVIPPNAVIGCNTLASWIFLNTFESLQLLHATIAARCIQWIAHVTTA